MTRQNLNSKVILSGSGSRCASEEIVCQSIPMNFYQEKVIKTSKVENACIWLSAYLVVRSFYSHLADHLPHKYKSTPTSMNGYQSIIKDYKGQIHRVYCL